MLSAMFAAVSVLGRTNASPRVEAARLAARLAAPAPLGTASVSSVPSRPLSFAVHTARIGPFPQAVRRSALCRRSAGVCELLPDFADSGTCEDGVTAKG